jgi:hypothetical protein
MNDNSMLPTKVRDLIHFDTLLEQGMEDIDRYAGQVWTDKGEQDPGVTLLQDFCYGTSDLAYRHTLPLVDLLTPADKSQEKWIFPAQFGPHRVLTCGPVTVDDYRRALLDLHSSDDGESPGCFYFRNVQLTPESEAEQYQYWYDPDPDKREFTFADLGDANSLTLKGNYHLYVELTRYANKAKAQIALDAFLSVNRNLCEAVRETTWVEPQDVNLISYLELEDDCTDYDRVLAELYMLTEAYLSPLASRAAASELSEQGVGNEAIYQGPQLRHGWITQMPPERDYSKSVEVDLSPLVNIWLSIDGVKSIAALDQYPARPDKWSVLIDANSYLQLWGSNPIASYLISIDYVCLNKKGQVFRGKSDFIKNYITPAPLITEKDVVMPYGRNRKPADFHSLSERLPPCYGLQQPVPSKAQKQLHQFLLPFEQALANGCQQLALLPDLLAFNRSESTPVWGEQWPFATDSLSDGVHQAYKPKLLSTLENCKRDDSKELAIIDYLLGYFGSQRAPRTLSGPLDDFLNVQRGYLRQHADLGYQRSNIQVQAVSALQKRIAARIGIGSALFDQALDLSHLPFYLVEHRALLPALPDEHYNAEQTPTGAKSDDKNKTFLLTVAVSPDHPLHVGLLIDLIIKGGGGPGNDYILPTVMVKDIDGAGPTLTCSMQDNEQLSRNRQKLIDAMRAGTLRWKNSNVWLQDMWYPLHYDTNTKLNDGKKSIVATQDAPYPVMLKDNDRIAIRRHIVPTSSLLVGDDQSVTYAKVVTRDCIKGSFVIEALEGSTLPEGEENYRWYIDSQGKTISDRFSFMVSLVFPRSLLAELTGAGTTQAWIKQCILDEIPCHISALMHWLDDSAFEQFGIAYQGWQNDGTPLGDRSYQLLKQLTLGRTPSVLDGIRHMRIATSAQQQAAMVPNWNPAYITENELFYVPKN